MFLRLLPLLLAMLLLTTTVRAQIVINEFMYYPDSSENEWVELYNRSPDAVSLDNWTIRDNSNESAKTLFDSIPSGGYLIVARRSQLFTAQYGTLSCGLIEVLFQQYNDNVGDAITVQNDAGDTIDHVPYEVTWGRERNRSLEKIDPALPSRQQSSWRLGTVPGGTPCTRNSTASVPGERHVAPPQVRLLDRRLLSITFDAPARNGRLARLVSSDGREALTTTLAERTGEIECSALPAGTYMLLITDRENATSVAIPVVLQ